MGVSKTGSVKYQLIPKPGPQGPIGPTGNAGPTYYPAGEYVIGSPNRYTRTASLIPFILFQKNYYLLNKIGEVGSSLNPQDDYAKNGKNATWVLVPKYEAAYFKIVLVDYALLGSAVFSKNRFISQHGILNGQPSSEYEKEGFIPNISMNWLTGEAHFARKNIVLGADGTVNIGKGNVIVQPNGDVKITGEVIARKGTIGGFNITESTIGDKNKKMWLSPDGIGFWKGGKVIGIGDCIPETVGPSDLIGGRIFINLGSYGLHDIDGGAFILQTKGGDVNSPVQRQVALKIITDNTEKDIAIDFIGGINCHAKDVMGGSYKNRGYTGVISFMTEYANNAYREKFYFYNGILTNAESEYIPI